MRTAVVGHVELVTFGRVDHVPAPGEIVHADDVFELPAGGGPVAAVQLLNLAGDCTFFTALGGDELGHRARRELEAMGVRVEGAYHPEPQRRAFTHVDAQGERTITVMGTRLGPRASDPLAWEVLDDVDAVYFCAGDDGALHHARRARVLVATSGETARLARTRRIPRRRRRQCPRPVGAVQAGEAGAGCGRRDARCGRRRYRAAGEKGTFAAELLRDPRVCAYGAGDSFAAGLSFALGAGYELADALRLASRCGAACSMGRGPYERQLTAADL